MHLANTDKLVAISWYILCVARYSRLLAISFSCNGARVTVGTVTAQIVEMIM